MVNGPPAYRYDKVRRKEEEGGGGRRCVWCAVCDVFVCDVCVVLCMV